MKTLLTLLVVVVFLGAVLTSALALTSSRQEAAAYAILAVFNTGLFVKCVQWTCETFVLTARK